MNYPNTPTQTDIEPKVPTPPAPTKADVLGYARPCSLAAIIAGIAIRIAQKNTAKASQ